VLTFVTRRRAIARARKVIAVKVMPKFVVLIKFQAIAATSILSVSAIVGLPTLAQEAEGEGKPTPIEVVDPVAEKEEAETLKAITADNPEIPTAQLEILLKPLPQEQVKAEAEAWFMTLQEKAQEISNTEIEIKLREEEAMDGAVDSEREKLVVSVTGLKEEQTGIASRLNTVLDSLDGKGGDSTIYRQYVEAVSGIEFNITDTESLGLRFTTWLQSEEGGIRWGINILKVCGILIVAVVIAPRAGKLTDTALRRVSAISSLFRGFIVMVVKRTVLVVGGLLAVTSIGISLGPLLAVVGGISFILAFALQSNLGNFASGLMLLLYKPFDVDDEVEIAGQWAVIKKITLANTLLQAWGNGKIISIPNSTVWGSTIINLTPKDGIRKFAERVFININEDLVKAKRVIDEVITAHPLVLQDYWHGTFAYEVKEYADIYYVARSKVEDYWTLHEELVLQVHSRLRQEGITFSTPEYHVSLNPTDNNEPYETIEQKDTKLNQNAMGVDFDPT
jgi:small conductance mechanosensitive channel